MAINDSKPIPELTTMEINLFWSKVDVRGPDECWHWKAGKFSGGYGEFAVKRRPFKAHRIAFYLGIGKDPFPLFACHACDARYRVGDTSYRSCCNPSHLFAANTDGNMRDMAVKGRAASGDRHGTKIHPDSVRRGDQHYSRIRPSVMAAGDRNGARTRPDRLPRGECNGFSRFTNLQVIEIRRRHAEDGVSCKSLARELGCSDVAVGLIVRRKTWKHI